ncbi:unnamed protein product [Linum trigynum]|uniref:Uncharacterized protein n=1 Tax=Linum trigynum TaxID=586398 RepID=A0AAV2DSC0_9ROSI
MGFDMFNLNLECLDIAKRAGSPSPTPIVEKMSQILKVLPELIHRGPRDLFLPYIPDHCPTDCPPIGHQT